MGFARLEKHICCSKWARSIFQKRIILILKKKQNFTPFFLAIWILSASWMSCDFIQKNLLMKKKISLFLTKFKHVHARSPVGKVDILTLHPLSFFEFLMALDDHKSLSLLKNLTSDSSIPDIAHQHLWEKLKYYFIVGGLPEAVLIFKNNQQNSFEACNKVRIKQHELITGYYSDIAKHAGKINSMHIDRVWHAVATQLNSSHEGGAEKFKFKNI